MKKTLFSAAVAGVALTASATAFASPLMETTGGVVGTSGFNARFTGHDASAAYFNPANLSRVKNGINVGLFVFNDAIKLRLGAREGLGVDIREFYGSRFENGDYLAGQTPIRTDFLYRGCEPAIGACDMPARPRQGAGSSGNTRAYASLGLVNQVVEDYLHVGLYALLPLGKFTTTNAFYVDEREQFFSNSLHAELYSDRLTAPSLSIGIGSSPIENLSIGVAFTLALITTADAGVYVPVADDQAGTLQLNAGVGVVAKVAPHLSVNYRPLENLQLSFTAHSPSRFDIGLGFRNLLPDGSEQLAVRKMVHDYNPWLFGLGGEYVFDLGNLDLTLTGGVTIGLWSNYVNRQNERPRPGYEWRNTVTPSLGARLGQGPWQAGVDFMFVPTPVPEQTGRTNYVDSNRFTTALTFDYTFDMGAVKMGVGANLQAHAFSTRRNTKLRPNPNEVVNPGSDNHLLNHNPNLIIDELPDALRNVNGDPLEVARGLQTNNPGFPWYESSGYMLGGGVYLSIYY